MENNVFSIPKDYFWLSFFYINNITEKVYMYSLTFNCIINTKINFRKILVAMNSQLLLAVRPPWIFFLIYSINQII